MNLYYCVKLVAGDHRNSTFKPEDDGWWHGYATGVECAPDGRWITQDINMAYKVCYSSSHGAFISTAVEEYML